MADRRGALLVLAVVFAVGLGVWFGRGQGALAPGPVAVEAGAAAGAPDDVARGVGAEVGKVGDEAVRQSAQARVFGHVYDHTGRALGGVPVVLQRHGTQPTKPKFRRALDPLPREEKGQVPYLPHATKSDAAGAFAFEAVEPAAYRVAAGTGRVAAEEVVVDPCEQQEVDLRFPADTVQLVGRATRGGRFASDLSVEVRTGPVPTPLAMEADGSFQSFFAAGPCTVRLRQHRLGKGSGAALVALVERRLVLAHGQGVVRCDLDVPATSLHARLAVVGGRLDGAAEFVAAGRTPDGDAIELVAPVGNDGTATFDNLPFGAWTVSVRGRSLVPGAPQPVDVALARPTAAVVLEARAAGIVRVRARDPFGAAIAVVDAGLLLVTEQGEQPLRDLRGDDKALGTAVEPGFAPVAAGRATLVGRDRERDGAWWYLPFDPLPDRAIDVVVGDQNVVDLRCERRALVRLRAVDIVGREEPGARIGVFAGDRAVHSAEERPSRFRSPLPPGDYRVVVERPGGRREQGLAVGRTDLDLKVRP